MALRIRLSFTTHFCGLYYGLTLSSKEISENQEEIATIKISVPLITTFHMFQYTLFSWTCIGISFLLQGTGAPNALTKHHSPLIVWDLGTGKVNTSQNSLRSPCLFHKPILYDEADSVFLFLKIYEMEGTILYYLYKHSGHR